MTTMENKLEKALGKLCSYLPPEESKPTIDTLLKIIRNTLDNPNEDKYRQLRLSNKTFYQQVWRHSAAQEFLTLVGWTVKEEKIILQSDELLQEAYAELHKAKHFIADIKPVGFSEEEVEKNEKALLEQLQLPEDDAKTFLEKFRKYGDLLPQSLLDYHLKFREIIDSAESVMGPLDEGRKSFPKFSQSHVKDFQKALELLEERHTLKQRQNKSEITVNELHSIENRLDQLAKEEQALDKQYENRNIIFLQHKIEIVQNSEKKSELKKELREREERLINYDVRAKAMPDTESLDFSRYVSPLPDSVHEFLDKQLDWDHDGVDVHLNKIAYHMKDWETKLSSLLGLSDIDIDDLKAMHPKPILLKRAVLRKWKEKKGLDATYRSLLKLCCKGGDARTANTICSVLKEKVQEMKEDAHELKGDTVPPSYRVSHEQENTGSSPPDLGYIITCPNCRLLIKTEEDASSKTLVYQGDIVHFKWDTHGFRLHIPEDALPSDVTEIMITIKAFVSCEHTPPANTELVSGLYSISSSHDFTKPVTLEIEHGCLLESPGQAEHLVFGHCSRKSPPCDFHIMKGGVFELKNNFGRISLKNFSFFALFRYLMSYVTPITRSPITRYCAGVYHSEVRRSPYSCYIYLVITKDAGIIKQEVRKYFRDNCTKISPNPLEQPVSFIDDRNAICPCISREAEEIDGGWKLHPAAPPEIFRTDVDSYVDGTIPHCRLYLTHLSTPSSDFIYDLQLRGASVQSIQIVIPCTSSEEVYHARASFNGLFKELLPLQTYWKTIGTFLKIPAEDLDAIQRDNFYQQNDCLREMIKRWLRITDPAPTWEELVEAVRLIDSRRAEEIKLKYTDICL